jgi:hypothetical protein
VLWTQSEFIAATFDQSWNMPAPYGTFVSGHEQGRRKHRGVGGTT